jgi:polyphosphate kinase
MSWLAFNERVLDQARADSHPLLERVKFLAIAANNLDEFFMVRVATLARDYLAGVIELSPDGLTIGAQLSLVRARAIAMLEELAECWSQTLRPLGAEGALRRAEQHRMGDATGRSGRARRPRRAGPETHCKICLVVRQEEEGIRRYVHVATGNYNRATAHIYTDVGLFTVNPRIVADVSELFNYVTGYSNQTDYRELLVAPIALRRRFAKLVAREVGHARHGRPARMIIKTNALCDPAIVRLLYRASQAGVVIDLIVRGICTLRPGVPGVSETIRVRSIVGRLLEHSRIWFFENDGKPETFIGSADLMERNLNARVEVVCPVLDSGIGAHLRHVVLEAYLRDNVRATMLRSDGTYEPIDPGGEPPLDAQTLLMSRKQREQLAASAL